MGRAANRRMPVAMVFGDHDISDDWHLGRAWEEAAQGHPFARRVIGNAWGPASCA